MILKLELSEHDVDHLLVDYARRMARRVTGDATLRNVNVFKAQDNAVVLAIDLEADIPEE